MGTEKTKGAEGKKRKKRLLVSLYQMWTYAKGERTRLDVPAMLLLLLLLMRMMRIRPSETSLISEDIVGGWLRP